MEHQCSSDPQQKAQCALRPQAALCASGASTSPVGGHRQPWSWWRLGSVGMGTGWLRPRCHPLSKGPSKAAGRDSQEPCAIPILPSPRVQRATSTLKSVPFQTQAGSQAVSLKVSQNPRRHPCCGCSPSPWLWCRRGVEERGPRVVLPGS